MLSTRITVMKTSVPALVQRRGETEKELMAIHMVSAKESLSSLAKLRVGLRETFQSGNHRGEF